ncbi:hypothetical protein LTR37_017074 [Vermiconidia calcicola]|uniref:Uncharacterized protein n=1 Tax=Vermiconidia calcicola TaxID=1690605 RepID=A0ACC3MKY4_9PEZI|nr:hypothetical protein LTR37_017074 [Vermiconidia calcicola]
MPSQEAFTATAITFAELQQNPFGKHWQSRWSRASEIFWDGLSSDMKATDSHVGSFIDLLVDQDRFALARLVITDLRSASILLSISPPQNFILQSTAHLRADTLKKEGLRQEDFDSAAYANEKRTQRESDLHRARILLHDSGGFGSASEEQILKWLDAAPTSNGEPSGSGAETSWKLPGEPVARSFILYLIMLLIGDIIRYAAPKLISAVRSRLLSLSRSGVPPNIIDYFGKSFSDPQSLIAGMAKNNCLLSGSRALEYFVPGSCATTSDWDFYTYSSIYCIGGALLMLRDSGVVWDDVYHPLRVLRDATAPTTITMNRDDVKEHLYRNSLWDYPVIGGLFAGVHAFFASPPDVRPVLQVIRDRMDLFPQAKSIRINEHAVLVLSRGRRSAYYKMPGVQVITGWTTHNNTNQKVQLVFAKKQSPMELIMAFYASSVQAFVSGFGAAHLYHQEAAKHLAYLWPSNTQHRASADTAMLKYNKRGWTFIRPPFNEQDNKPLKQLCSPDGNTAKVVTFNIPLDIPVRLEQARRWAFQHLAWIEIDGETSYVNVVSKKTSDVLKSATTTRRLRFNVHHGVDLDRRVESRAAKQHCMGIHLLSGQNDKFADELLGF